MRPVLTPAAMNAVDASSGVAVAELIRRAGWAVARCAVEMMGGTYGRRVLIIAGRGNNGNDGRVAAQLLAARGVRVVVRDTDDSSPVRGVDLVIDAAFGTGFRGTYVGPDVDEVPVLAVDIASGIDALSGAACGRVLVAQRTVSFAALKPGHLFGDGPAHCGHIDVVGIGLDLAAGYALEPDRVDLVETSDLLAWAPQRQRDAHKWQAATWVIGGSPDMAGAPSLAARGAQSAGASYVRVSVVGAEPRSLPLEAVSVPLGRDDWGAWVAEHASRVGSVVIGPGLGRESSTVDSVVAALSSLTRPTVVDADALWAWATQRRRFRQPAVLTPHDGEYGYLMGEAVGPDRIGAARSLAARANAVVVLKGSTTVIAAVDGRVRLVRAGDQRLATAGTGDVLSGVIGALMAQGLEPFDAAAAAAQVHGEAALGAPKVGMRARDLCGAISALLSNAVNTRDPHTATTRTL